MPMVIGARLGPYEIVGVLGAGGMGEVYKARDVRLDRIVAVKVLSAQLAGDPQFRERFEREARSISSLNHPHICALYDIGEAPVQDPEGVAARDPAAAPAGQDAVRFLVMEYLDGETLADRLTKGALPLDQALRYAIEIADVLDKAHGAGIVHRDLKPGNVMLTKSGTKLLDFGLAKATPQAVAGGGLSMLPTTPPNLTEHGTILGTFPYMAPEQLEGREADARTDVFAFGVIVHEMLTGRKAFEGRSQASLISAILRDEPPPVSMLQPLSPPGLDRIVRKCLAKDPERRWRSAHDLHDELQWIAEGAAAPGSPGAFAATGRSVFASVRAAWVAAVLFLLTTLIAGTIAYFGRLQPDVHVYRASIPLPLNFNSAPPSNRVAISPDGRRLAFVAAGTDGRVMIWIRPADGPSVQALVGTEGAAAAFWSGDSRYVAFIAGGKLKKIDASGGPALTLCDAPATGLPGSWNQENVILFAPANGSPLAQVSAAGGTPSAVTTLDTKAGETRHAFPSFLPDGRHFLYVAYNGDLPLGVYVASLDSPERRKLLDGVSNAAYAQGYLSFLRDSTLMAQAFDVRRLVLKGEAMPVVEQVSSNTATARAGAFSVSQTGALVYHAGLTSGASRLAWLDREGRQTSVGGDLANYGDLQLSPDGTRAAVSLATDSGGNHDIWIVDLTRSSKTRFTFDPADELSAVWSPDGSRIVFNSSRRKGHLDLYVKALNGGPEDLLLADDLDKTPNSWSPDGQFVLYSATGAPTGQDLWIVPLSGDRKPFPYLQTPFNETMGQFSADGKWIAYRSSESNRFEVYVASFPAASGKWQVSTATGDSPRWRRDGKELFYRQPTDNRLMAASIAAGDRFQVGTVRPLPGVVFRPPAGRRSFYDVAPDGNRFLVNMVEEDASAVPIQLIVNWTAALRK